MSRKDKKKKNGKLSGFLSLFVEGIDEEDNLDLISDGPYDENYADYEPYPSEDGQYYPGQDVNLFEGNEPYAPAAPVPEQNYPFSDEEDLEAVSHMKWDDGESVVNDLPEPEPEQAYPYPDEPVEEDYPEEALPPEPDTSRSSRKRSGHTWMQRLNPHGEDEEHPGNEFLSDEEMEAYLHETRGDTEETDEEADAQEEPLPENTDDILYGLPPEDEYWDNVPKRRVNAKTTILRDGGSSTAVRVNVNETETIKAVKKAAKENRAAEAQRQHERYIEKKKKIEKRKKFFKNFSLTFAFIIFCVIALLVAIYFTFQLTEILVTGNDQYSAEYITELSGLRTGQHAFFMDLDKAKADIQSDPYLQVNDITYIFPSRVRIDVSERREVAAIIGLDYNIIIDENGYVLSMSSGADLSKLLQVTGVSVAGFKLGERIGESSDFSTSTLISLIRQLNAHDLLGKIRTLDMTTPLAITMYTDTGFKIFLGQPTDLDSKFVSLSVLLPRFEASAITSGTLYLSAKGGTVYSPPSASNLVITGNIAAEPPAENPEDLPTGEDGELLPETTPEPTPEPTATPLPLQPGGGDEFQG